MIHYDYSPRQLEAHASELLRKYDPERLTKCKPLDVYDVIEKCLDVPYDWKYITPDQSILGLTAFCSGTLYVWPEPEYTPGMKPYKIFLDEGTILIDSTLTESPDRGRENFTVMHEIFHQVLHKRCFRHSNPDYTHCTTSNALKLRKARLSSLEICEYQANRCAADFLMPRGLLIETVRRYKFGMLDFSSNTDYMLAKDLADEFNVSAQAMKIRLQTLGLAAR